MVAPSKVYLNGRLNLEHLPSPNEFVRGDLAVESLLEGSKPKILAEGIVLASVRATSAVPVATFSS
jgi:hypothetical protein